MSIVRMLAAATFVLVLVPAPAFAKVRVVASINDLASIAATVGGDQVETFAIARPAADIHRVEVLPSYMVRVSKSDLYLEVGLGLDTWAAGIISGSRNARLTVVDCSRDVRVLEKPTGKVTALVGVTNQGQGAHTAFAQVIADELGVSVDDVNVSDILDPAFVYQAGTIRVDNSVATGAANAAIFAAVSATAPVSDANDGDAAGIAGTTLTAGSGGGNAQVNIAASGVYAVLFDVIVQ